MKTVSEVSKLTGVSVRALHHYNSLNLLKPAKISEAGYRLYDDTAIQRLQTILLFRELRFSLKDIKKIIDSPSFDKQTALKQQIELLKLQRTRLDELISFASEIMITGVNTMDFSAFDKSEIEKYTLEAKEKWGKSAAYKEYEVKSAERSKREENEFSLKLMDFFVKAGKMRSLSLDNSSVQQLVEELRQFISANYYNCTIQIFSGLAQIYSGDERIKKSIDTAGGEGTAEFISKAIQLYCERCPE